MLRQRYRLLIVATLVTALPTVTVWSDPIPQFALRWGSYGDGPGQFAAAADVAVGVGGNVYVVDGGGHDRIEVFAPDGTFLYLWSTGLSPDHLAIDHVGNIFCLANGTHVAKFTLTGSTRTTSTRFKVTACVEE